MRTTLIALSALALVAGVPAAAKDFVVVHKDLDEYSLDTVKMFYEDAKKVGYTL